MAVQSEVSLGKIDSFILEVKKVTPYVQPADSVTTLDVYRLELEDVINSGDIYHHNTLIKFKVGDILEFTRSWSLFRFFFLANFLK